MANAHTSSRRPQVMAGLVALALAITTAVLPALVIGRALDQTDVLVGLLFGSALLPLFLEAWSPTGDILSPVPMIGAIVIMEFVGRCLFLRYGDVNQGDLPPNMGSDYEQYLTPALQLATVSWLAALVGYALPLGRAVMRALPRVPLLQRDIHSGRVLVIFAISVIFKGVQVARGTYLAFATADNVDHDTQSYVDFLSSLSTISMFVLAALDFRKRLGPTMRLWLWGVIVPSELAWGLFTGGKMRFFMPLLLILMARHYFAKRIALRHLAAAAAVLVFVVLPIISQFRLAYGRGGSKESIAENAASAQMAAEELRKRDDYASDSLHEATNRLHGLDSVMIAMKMTPTYIPWGDDSLYLMLPAMAVVPRILWKSKPIMMVLPNWEVDYWGNSRDSRTCISRTHVGALYAVFGWWGTVLGMFLVGIAWRLTYEFARHNWGPLGAALYITNLFVIIRIENDVPMVYSQLIKTIIVTMAVFAFIAERKSPRLHRSLNPA